MRQTKTNPAAPATAETITTDNLGIISGRAIHYHRFLPLHVRRHYEADDMINDCCLHVFRQAAEGKYDPAKAKPVTWCYHVADNHCKTILSHWSSQKYTNYETAELEPLLRFAERDATAPTKRAIATIEAAIATEVPQMLTEDSVNAVEGVLRHAAPWMRELLEQLLCGRLDRVSAPPDKECFYELQELAARYGATLRDFELVRQNYGEAYA
jgi:DNA-directed RNA polymerase specialized sigma24 family protein